MVTGTNGVGLRAGDKKGVTATIMTTLPKKTFRTRLKTNRHLLRLAYYPWVVLPRRPRRAASIAGVWWLQVFKRARGIHRRLEPTPPSKMFSLSFWGVPQVDVATYTLTVDGAVERPTTLTLAEVQELPAIERDVTLDCVGGSRNNCTMRGVPIADLMHRAGAKEEALTAIFHCADGYFTTHPVRDLLEDRAFMAYATNGVGDRDHGYPLRLVAPGKYGYKWAKWVVRIELVAGSPKGYWEQRGLPDRARVGDVS